MNKIDHVAYLRLIGDYSYFFSEFSLLFYLYFFCLTCFEQVTMPRIRRLDTYLQVNEFERDPIFGLCKMNVIFEHSEDEFCTFGLGLLIRIQLLHIRALFLHMRMFYFSLACILIILLDLFIRLKNSF